MKIYNKNMLWGLGLLAFFSTASFTFAVTPPLGMVAGYSILSSTYTNTTITTVNGSIGFTTGPAMLPLGIHTNYGSGVPYAQAGIDQGTMLAALNAQPCTFTFAPGAINLSTDATHGIAGVYTPGVYCSLGAMNIGGPITLSGAGTYIFRPVGALTSAAGSAVTLLGASSCDIFWTPSQATTLAANTTFGGTVIDNAGITVGANTTWNGMALAFGGTVTTDTDTLTVPVCVVPVPIPVPVPPVPVPASSGGTTSSASYFSYIPPVIKILKVPTPNVLPNGQGLVTYNYTVTNAGTVSIAQVKVIDDKCVDVQYLSGDANGDTKLDITEIWSYRCSMVLTQTTTNIATATGYANFSTTTDTANATVTVTKETQFVPVIIPSVLGVATTTLQAFAIYPRLPDAGFEEGEKNTHIRFILLVMSIVIVMTILTTKKMIYAVKKL